VTHKETNTTVECEGNNEDYEIGRIIDDKMRIGMAFVFIYKTESRPNNDI
jgi:hypothetical protein